MSIKPNKKYHGTVANGSRIMTSNSGTLGFQLLLDCEDGATEFIIWLTEKNKDRARAAFVDVLGVAEDKLQDANYFEYMLPEEIAGRPVTFSTVEEEYKGYKKTKVGFIFKSSALDGKSAGKAVARFFGAAALDDDDISF